MYLCACAFLQWRRLGMHTRYGCSMLFVGILHLFVFLCWRACAPIRGVWGQTNVCASVDAGQNMCVCVCSPCIGMCGAWIHLVLGIAVASAGVCENEHGSVCMFHGLVYSLTSPVLEIPSVFPSMYLVCTRAASSIAHCCSFRNRPLVLFPCVYV